MNKACFNACSAVIRSFWKSWSICFNKSIASFEVAKGEGGDIIARPWESASGLVDSCKIKYHSDLVSLGFTIFIARSKLKMWGPPRLKLCHHSLPCNICPVSQHRIFFRYKWMIFHIVLQLAQLLLIPLPLLFRQALQ